MLRLIKCASEKNHCSQLHAFSRNKRHFSSRKKAADRTLNLVRLWPTFEMRTLLVMILWGVKNDMRCLKGRAMVIGEGALSRLAYHRDTAPGLIITTLQPPYLLKNYFVKI